MPVDPFQNARAYYDVTFPNSGDSFLQATSAIKNAFQGLGFMDFIPLQPRAHNPANTSIMVRGRDASAYYNPVYAGDADAHIFFSSGDSPTMAAPSSNPRLDIVYLTPSGDLRIITGAEAATPTLPSLSPSGDNRIPICAVYHKVGETKIVNFEDKDSNTGDGYIYQDLRPFLRAHGFGGTTLTSTSALSITGDNAAGSASTAARADHTHQGVHAVRKVGSANLQGDVEVAASGDINVTQVGNRITVGHNSGLECVTGSYVGDGADDRWMTVGFQDTTKRPKRALIFKAAAASMPVRLDVFIGDASELYDTAAGFSANMIQALGANSFQVGTNAIVNESGTTFYYCVIG